MRSVTLVSALLLCSWISVSGSESHTVDVQPGHSVTLQCSSSLNNATYTFWSRLINRTTISCISYKYQFYSQFPCEGLKNSKYEMKSGISTISLAIKHVDVSDSGQYLCGFYLNGHTVLKVVDLNVQGSDKSQNHTEVSRQKEPDVLPNLMSVILGAVTVFLVLIIIVLAVKYRKIQKVVNKKQILQRNKNLDCDDLKAAPLTLYSATTVRSRRPEAERQVDTHVVYAASR
ncbi:hypothetical protein EXN66_Car013256 [Channa argus]|uniref:Immunoglobulin domain-containing protein n=1 Tax=Channa argus TaxID=215402 RepID=A0A6G1Q5X0_CHAAH|nr:hypothetical protein EXN66_Car013256 [Channa argus]